MSDNNNTSSTRDESLKILAGRIPYVLAAFVGIFVVIVIGLVASIGYVPMNQRLFCVCLVGTVCFITFLLTLIYVFKLIKYIIDTGNTKLLSSQG